MAFSPTPMMSWGIHPRAVWQEVPMNLIRNIYSDSTRLKLSHLQGTNEFVESIAHYSQIKLPIIPMEPAFHTLFQSVVNILDET